MTDTAIATPIPPLVVARAEHGISRKDISPNALYYAIED